MQESKLDVSSNVVGWNLRECFRPSLLSSIGRNLLISDFCLTPGSTSACCLITAFVALQDINSTEVGATEVYSGTHVWEAHAALNARTRDEGMREIALTAAGFSAPQPVSLNARDCLVTDSRYNHRSGANTDEQKRRAKMVEAGAAILEVGQVLHYDKFYDKDILFSFLLRAAVLFARPPLWPHASSSYDPQSFTFCWSFSRCFLNLTSDADSGLTGFVCISLSFCAACLLFTSRFLCASSRFDAASASFFRISSLVTSPSRSSSCPEEQEAHTAASRGRTYDTRIASFSTPGTPAVAPPLTATCSTPFDSDSLSSRFSISSIGFTGTAEPPPSPPRRARYPRRSPRVRYSPP